MEWVSGIHRATANDVSEELKYISVHLFKRERKKKKEVRGLREVRRGLKREIPHAILLRLQNKDDINWLPVKATLDF